MLSSSGLDCHIQLGLKCVNLKFNPQSTYRPCNHPLDCWQGIIFNFPASWTRQAICEKELHEEMLNRRDKSLFPIPSHLIWIRVKFWGICISFHWQKLSYTGKSNHCFLSLFPSFMFSFPAPSLWQPRQAAVLSLWSSELLLNGKFCCRLVPEHVSEPGESPGSQMSTSKFFDMDVQRKLCREKQILTVNIF